MRQKETPHKSPSKLVLPSVIEFSILGPNWFDDSFLGSVDVSQLDTPESIPLAPLPSSLEEKKEQDTEHRTDQPPRRGAVLRGTGDAAVCGMCIGGRAMKTLQPGGCGALRLAAAAGGKTAVRSGFSFAAHDLFQSGR